MESSEKITLPCDAGGREIPLDTKVLYDEKGNEQKVRQFVFPQCTKHWVVDFESSVPFCLSRELPENYRLTSPDDSWDKLLDDLDNAAKGGDNAECLYMRREDIEVGEQCSGCRLYNADDVFSDCSCLAYANIADRIRKLRGED